MEWPGENQAENLKKIIVKMSRIFDISSIHPWNKPDCPRIFKKTRFVFYVLNNNFFYSQVASFYVLDNADTFYLFLLQKDFDIFHVLISGVFLCVFDNIYLLYLYTQKNVMKNIFLISFKK